MQVESYIFELPKLYTFRECYSIRLNLPYFCQLYFFYTGLRPVGITGYKTYYYWLPAIFFTVAGIGGFYSYYFFPPHLIFLQG